MNIINVNEEGLKPCPFCGREAHLYTSGWTDKCIVGCIYCKVVFCHDFEEKAVAEWNERDYE